MKSARSLRVDAQRCSEQATTVNLINSTQERPVLAVVVIRTNTTINRQQDDTMKEGYVKAPLISRRETVDQINPSAICGFLRSVEKTNKNSFLLVTQNYYTQDSKLVRDTN